MAVTDQLRRTSVTWWIALDGAFADRNAPTTTEINTSPLVFEVTCAIDEEGTTFQLGDSETDNRYSFCTEAGIDRPTSYNPEAEIAFYRDADRTATGAFADAFNLLHAPDVPLYIIQRIGDQDNTPGTAAAVGDKINMQYIKTDYGVDTLAAEDPAMMTQSGLQQGWVNWVYTLQA